MKKLILCVSLLAGSIALAKGPTVSGGVPPVPRAVVLQGHLGPNGFDLEGRKLALELAAVHLVNERVTAITQRKEAQNSDRTYICIEYVDPNDKDFASEEFQTLLKGHTSIEVVTNSSCK